MPIPLFTKGHNKELDHYKYVIKLIFMVDFTLADLAEEGFTCR
jgi:hypothetical protein